MWKFLSLFNALFLFIIAATLIARNEWKWTLIGAFNLVGAVLSLDSAIKLYVKELKGE